MTERRPRFYFPEPLRAGGRYTLTGEQHHYLARVLRLKAGGELVVFDGSGGEYRSVIEEVQRARSTLRIGEFRDTDNESPLSLRLAQGVGRGERTDLAIQKAVELGVTSIVPLLTRRGIVRLDASRAERRLAHWQGIVVHACQQCGRNRIPPLHAVVPLDEWLQGYQSDGLDLILDWQATGGIDDLEYDGGTITLLVGPEGGWDPAERDAAIAAGFRGVALGPRILRTETAAIAALTAAQSRWGDL
jgi:16S rRNA (uracil1498-N3)-methyltransferase